MSKRSRGNDYAPSTFPFLAVLLCVIGALILLLVINVTNSRASAKKQVQDELSDAIEQAKEQSDYLVSISEELKARREQVQKQVESRRRELTRTEDHIKRLEEQLQEAISRLRNLEDTSTKRTDSEDKQSRIEELKALIQKEKEKLSEKIEQRKDQTPAFSIIPYEGANRTTRRPVYLECTQDGVVIQPEGVRLSMDDLGPPHGPGNPLDAALRVLRTAYQSRDAVYGITIPPYPLLLVRPDGIHSYALARAAMSGWDDQFGYELIDSQMELAYPDSIPELKNELTKSLALAKERQRALVAALPARFSRNPYASKSSDTWDSIDAQSTSGVGKSGGSQEPTNGELQSDDSQNGRRWEMIQQLPTGSGPVAQRSNASEPNSKVSSLPAVSSGLPGMSLDASPDGTNDSLPQSRKGESPGGSDLAMGDRQGGYDTVGGSMVESDGTQSQGSLTPSSSGANSTANRFSSAAGGSSGGGTNAAQSSEDAQMEQAVKEQAMKEQGVKDPSVKPNSAQRAGSQRASGSESELKPISLTAGKDWATTRMDNKSTPVSRPIRIIVLQDRWLMCREGQDWKYDAEILLEQGPQAASEQLRQAIRERVDSWGLSLPGGYWVPSLTVQAAADADQSVQRLQKLLEGSGVVIKVQPLMTPSIRK